jgi:hypothetical protein
MLKNTKNAFISIINEIKLVCKIIKYSSIVVSLVYFLIALLTKTGNFIANIISLSLFIVYTIFEICTRNIEKKKIRKVVRRIYVSARLLIRAFALGTIIYGIYTATTDVTALSIILLVLMIIFWILQVLFEVIVFIVSRYVNIVAEELKRDADEFKEGPGKVIGKVAKPIVGAVNVFKKIKNQFSKDEYENE